MGSVRQVLVALMQSSVMAASTCFLRNSVAFMDPCALTPYIRYARCIGTAWAIDKREVSKVEVKNKKLEVVPEFCYLGDMLSAGGSCEHTQMCMGKIPPIISPSHQPPSAPSDQR